MSSPPTSRRHHVVPKFLLNKFAEPRTSKGVLYALDKHTGDVRVASSNNVTIEKDYYLLPDDPELAGYAKDLPEGDLSRIEAAAAPVIGRLCDGSILPESFDARASLALFTAVMRARTPREREQFAAASEHRLNEVARQAHHHRNAIRRFLEGRQDSVGAEDLDAFAQRMKDASDKDEIHVKVPIDRSLGTLLRLAVEMAAGIEQMSWWILRASGEHAFVISDCPLAMYDVALREGRGNAFNSSPLAETTLPLSPDACLQLRTSGPRLAERRIEASDVDEINLRTYAWANRWSFGSEESVVAAHDLARREPISLARVAPRPYFQSPRSP